MFYTLSFDNCNKIYIYQYHQYCSGHLDNSRYQTLPLYILTVYCTCVIIHLSV